jgi:hypothetical protein
VLLPACLPADLTLFRFLVAAPRLPLFPQEYVGLTVILALEFLHIPVWQYSGLQQLFFARLPHVVLHDNLDVGSQLLSKLDASLGILIPQPSTGFFVMRSIASASALHRTFLHRSIVLVDDSHTKTPERRRLKAWCGLTEVQLRRHCPRRIVAAERSFRAQAAKHTVSRSLVSLPALISLRNPIGCRPRCADAVSIRCCTAIFCFLMPIVESTVLRVCWSM